MNYEYQEQTTTIETNFCTSNSEVPRIYITAPPQSDKFDVSSKLVLEANIYYSEEILDIVWSCYGRCASVNEGNPSLWLYGQCFCIQLMQPFCYQTIELYKYP